MKASNDASVSQFLAGAVLLLALFVAFSCNPANRELDAQGASNGRGSSNAHPAASAPFAVDLRFDGAQTPQGKFEDLSSVAVGGGSVFVADRAYSSVYIFSDDGRYLDSIGCGFKIADRIMTDEELMISDMSPDEKLPADLSNAIARNEFFKPDDLDFAVGHLFVLSSYFSSLSSDAALTPSLFEFTAGGQFQRRKQMGTTIAPVYLAVDSRGNMAVSDVYTDEYWTADAIGEDMHFNKTVMIGIRSYFYGMLMVKGDPVKYNAYRNTKSNTGIGKFQFKGISGLTSYTPVINGDAKPEETKLLICDSGNNRIKVHDFRGELFAIIEGTKAGVRSFGKPLDICFLSDGRAAILDGERKEIVLMKPDFTFEPGFGKGELNDPRSICADAQGRLWVADPGSSSVVRFSPKP